MIILLDGSKGSGKSTTAKALLPHLKNTIYLSIDDVRHTLPLEPKRDIREKNQEAFEIMITKTEESILGNMDVIVDCGLIEDRVTRFDDIARDKDIRIHKFFLQASYEMQLERVKERDKAKGKKSTDVERFDEIYNLFKKKNLDSHTILDTDRLEVQKVIDIILNAVG